MKKRKKKKNTLQHTLFALILTLLLAFFFWTNEESVAPSAPPEEGSPPVIYSNLTGDNLEKTFVHAISKANHSLLFFIYALNAPEIIDALKAKSLQGISVKVIYDAKASTGVDRKLGTSVDAAARISKGLMHKKILVVDNSEVWIGSANMTKDSLEAQGNLVAAMRSKTLAEVITQAECSGNPCPPQKVDVGGQEVELWLLPDTHLPAVKRIDELLKSAQKTIHLAMFTFTRTDFAQDLIDAKKRGVKVEVFLDHQSAKGTSAKIVAMLKKADIPVYTNPGQSILHYKFLLVDNETLVNGSANWTQAAFKQNDDCFMILPHLEEKQKDKMREVTDHLKKTMKPLKLALSGRGKMGKEVAAAAIEQGHQIVDSFADADLCIDFSHASKVMKTIYQAANLKKNIVIGTTGWHDDLAEARTIVDQSGIGLLYSPNFSIGVHLYIKMLQAAAKLMEQQHYDIAGFEMHHREKADSPSGTAKAISEIFNPKLQFSSLRVGHVPGTHTIIFDSSEDQITLTHTAKGRAGFALGAIKAAEWLHGRKGFYTLEDIL